MPSTAHVKLCLNELGVDMQRYAGEALCVRSPIDGSEIAKLAVDDATSVDTKIGQSVAAFDAWRVVPAPKRGELVREFGNVLRHYKEPLATLVTLECGKLLEEGRGEVQEMIDICDFAVGLSRQLYGLTIASERPSHVMQENWLPLGPVGVISAFNFPVAVWAWNTALALVCGDSIVWKPSEKTPLTALACQHLFEKAAEQVGDVPPHLCQLLIGEKEAGAQLVNDARIPLISATGSTAMGLVVGPKVQSRFGKLILELGGNNAIILTPSADMDVALPSILFGSVGTAGQRCTSTRRLFVQRAHYDDVLAQLKTAYGALKNKIGSPLEGSTLVGPLIDDASLNAMQAALKAAKSEGHEVHFGDVLKSQGGAYVHPALVACDTQTDVVMEETFAPILYVMPYDTLDEAIALQNAVKQGLSSAIFTTDMREAEHFKRESDCGIANVNIGTSGAEIGGAFGGEKETGGGRESGSDAWKQYMRRQTSTSYYGAEPAALAQGISFNISE